MSWDEVALRYGTDKASSHHGYMDTYQELFENRWGQLAPRLLEIGVAGGRSLAMWAEVLPTLEVLVGIDNNRACLSHQRWDRIVVWADAADPAAMAAVSTLYGPFDIVIDDGSHVMHEVRMAFEELYPRLNHGGIYVIEDLGYENDEVAEFVLRWDARWIPMLNDTSGLNQLPGLIVVEKP